MGQAEQWEWEATRDEETRERWLKGEFDPDPDEAYDQWVEDRLFRND